MAACKKHGVECHVWKVNFRMGYRATKEHIRAMKEAGRTQLTFDGTANDEWLCPSHPANQRLEIESMVEVATKYDVDGVHFDYIRYPNENACFCDGCRKRFEEAVGKKVPDWPEDVRNEPWFREQWLDFRRAQITSVVAGVSRQLDELAPEVEISAAVFRNWVKHRDTIGQDWKTWCDEGYLDFVCPMDYIADTEQFALWVEQQSAWSGGVPCYPGIGLSVWPDPTDICKLIEQIKVTRRLGTGGFTVFNYNMPAAEEVLPLCGLGITRPGAIR